MELNRIGTRYSVTTSKHINRFLAGSAAVEVDDAFFSKLLVTP